MMEFDVHKDLAGSHHRKPLDAIRSWDWHGVAGFRHNRTVCAGELRHSGLQLLSSEHSALEQWRPCLYLFKRGVSLRQRRKMKVP